MRSFSHIPGRRNTQSRGKGILLWPVILFLVVLLPPLAGTPSPQTMETPIDVQVPLFLKILPFDRNFKRRMGDEIVLGILYQEKYRTSLNVKEQVERYFQGMTERKIDDISFRWVCIPLVDPAVVQEVLKKEQVDIMYITPLRAVDVGTLAKASRSLGITSMTGVTEYCPKGIAISIGTKGGAPLIHINLTAAHSEGIDFSSRLLKLAKVIE